MENEHDIIYKEIEQKGTILSIEVTLSQVDAEEAACLFDSRDIEYEPGWTVAKA